MSYIEDLSAITTPSLTDLLYIYQNGDDFKVTNQQLLDLIKTNTVIPLTQAQYDALTPAEKNNGSIYIITDGTITADDVEYSSGVSVKDKLDSLKIIKTGKGNYSGLKGGGWADRVTVTVTFDTPMPNANYVAFAMVDDAFADFPNINIYPVARSTTGFTAICINTSGSQTGVSGSFDWVAIS